MDARHKFIVSTLSDALGMDESQVEDHVLVDERVRNKLIRLKQRLDFYLFSFELRFTTSSSA